MADVRFSFSCTLSNSMDEPIKITDHDTTTLFTLNKKSLDRIREAARDAVLAQYKMCILEPGVTYTVDRFATTQELLAEIAQELPDGDWYRDIIEQAMAIVDWYQCYLNDTNSK